MIEDFENFDFIYCFLPGYLLESLRMNFQIFFFAFGLSRVFEHFLQEENK